MSCRACGHFLSDTSEDHFFGFPQVATNLPADPELCRLCECFRLLATVLRQLDPRTGVVRHAILVLGHFGLLFISTSSYAVEVQEIRVADEVEGNDTPENAGREPSSSGAGSEAEP